MTIQEQTIQDALTILKPLTEEERLNARDRARELVKRKYPKPAREQYDTAGPQPNREQFEESHISEFPKWVTRVIGIMLLIAFVGAFATSAFSVFSAGRNHFAETMEIGAGVGWQAVVVGISVVLLAEFMVITSVLAARIYFKGKRLWQLGMVIPAAAGVTIAITANAIISQPQNFWQWLVTIAPPASVIFLSIIGEQVILSDVRRHHANERAFQKASAEWKVASRTDDEAYTQTVRQWEQEVSDPEKTPVWQSTYANQLRQMIRRVNGRGRGKTEREDYMAAMTGPQWSAAVHREMASDSWFQEDMQPVPFGLQDQPVQMPIVKPVATIRPQPKPVTVSTNGNGTTHR